MKKGVAVAAVSAAILVGGLGYYSAAWKPKHDAAIERERQRQADQQADEALKSLIRAKVEDPESAEFVNLHRFPNDGMACGKVSSRNKEGRMSQHLLFLTDGSQAFYRMPDEDLGDAVVASPNVEAGFKANAGILVKEVADKALSGGACEKGQVKASYMVSLVEACQRVSAAVKSCDPYADAEALCRNIAVFVPCADTSSTAGLVLLGEDGKPHDVYARKAGR